MDAILEGSLDPDCLGPMQVNVYDPQGNLLPTSPFVDDTYEGQYLTAEVVDLNSTNNCDAVIWVVDHLVPALTCHNLQVDCDVDTDPIVPVSVSPNTTLEVLNGCQSIVLPVAITDNLTDVNVHLEVEHADVGELSAELLSPMNTLVTLFNNPPSCTDADLSVTFDDHALATYSDFENTCGSDPAIQGTFQPFGTLADFAGENPSGNWTFTLCNSSLTNTARATVLNLVLNTSGITIPFPLPDSTTISQTPAQIGTNEFTVTNFDNCGAAILSYVDARDVLNCTDPRAEILYRTWTIEDAYGNTDTCVDTIVRNRLPAGSIDYPLNYTGGAGEEPALLCEEETPDPGNSIIPNIGWNSLPNGHPSPFDEYYPAPNEDVVKWFGTGFPQAQGCETVSYSYTDNRINVCQTGTSDACFKIVRTWTVWETCSGQSYQHIQTIKVADGSGPQISGVADLTISTPSTACTADWYATVPQLSDNCNPESELSYTIHSSAGSVRYVAGLNRYLVENLPLGDAYHHLHRL